MARVTDWPGVKVTGKVTPDTEKPVPVSVAELMVTAAAPVELKVSVCDVAVPTATLPNATLPALRLNAGAATSTCTLKLSVIPPRVAVSCTFWDAAGVATEALKLALVAPAATVTDAGTVTVELLLVRLTLVPPAGAAEVSDMVHGSVPDPMTARLQLRLLSDGPAVSVATPVPLRPTTAVPSVVASLVTVNCPVAEPEAAGSNLMVVV